MARLSAHFKDLFFNMENGQVEKIRDAIWVEKDEDENNIDVWTIDPDSEFDMAHGIMVVGDLEFVLWVIDESKITPNFVSTVIEDLGFEVMSAIAGNKNIKVELKEKK